MDDKPDISDSQVASTPEDAAEAFRNNVSLAKSETINGEDCEIYYSGSHEWFCKMHDVSFVGPAGSDINNDGDEPVSCPPATSEGG